MIYQMGHPVKEAILHCAAIQTGQFNGMTAFEVFATVNRWHCERGWRGFGYHLLVMPDGATVPGRPPGVVGAHTQGHNTGTLGVLLIESRKIDKLATFYDYFQAPQRDVVRRFLAQTGVTIVKGHNDYAPKLCPGFKVVQSDWL